MPDKKSNKKKWIIIVIAVLFIIATIILSLGRDNKNTILLFQHFYYFTQILQADRNRF